MREHFVLLNIVKDTQRANVFSTEDVNIKKDSKIVKECLLAPFQPYPRRRSFAQSKLRTACLLHVSLQWCLYYDTTLVWPFLKNLASTVQLVASGLRCFTFNFSRFQKLKSRGVFINLHTKCFPKLFLLLKAATNHFVLLRYNK